MRQGELPKDLGLVKNTSRAGGEASDSCSVFVP